MRNWFSLTRFVPHVAVLLGEHRSLPYRYLVAKSAIRCVAVRVHLGLVSAPQTDREILGLIFEVAKELDSTALASVADSESHSSAINPEERTAVLQKKYPRTAEFVSALRPRLLARIKRYCGQASWGDALMEDVMFRAEYKFLSYADSQMRQGNPRVEQSPELWEPLLFGSCLRAAFKDQQRANCRYDFLIPFSPRERKDAGMESSDDWMDRRRNSIIAEEARNADLNMFPPNAHQGDESEVMRYDGDLRDEGERIASLLRFFELAGKHRPQAHAVWEQLLKYPECLSWQNLVARLEQFLSNARRNAWCDAVTRNAKLGTAAKSPAARNKAVSRIREALREAWEAAKPRPPFDDLPGQA